MGFPSGSSNKESACNADAGSTPGLGRSPGVGNGNPLQYSCLEKPMDWEAWRAPVHRVSKSQTQLKQLSMRTHTAAAKSLQSCPTLCDPIDGSPPGSPVPGILQARTLEWVAISFSNAWKWKVKGKSLSRVRLLATPWTAAHQAPPSMGFSRQEYWSGVPLPSLHTHTSVNIKSIMILIQWHNFNQKSLRKRCASIILPNNKNICTFTSRNMTYHLKVLG